MRRTRPSARVDTRKVTGAGADGLALPRGRRPIPTQTNLRARTVPVVPYLAGLLLLPGLVVAGFMNTDWWATTGTSAATRTTGVSAVGGPSGASPSDPIAAADVKGSMTVQQVVDAFPAVTAAEVLAQFGAPTDTPASTQFKTLVEAGNGVDIPALRTWLAEQVQG